MAKKRSYTEAERREVERWSLAGFLGRQVDSDRLQQLFNINPREYGVVNRRVRQAEADRVKERGF